MLREPQHGSWLNVAESELGVLASQCLDRRIADKQILVIGSREILDRRDRPRGGGKVLRTHRSGDRHSRVGPRAGIGKLFYGSGSPHIRGPALNLI